MIEFFHNGFVKEQFIQKIDRIQYNYNNYKIRRDIAIIGNLNIGDSISFVDFGSVSYLINEIDCDQFNIDYVILDMQNDSEVGQIKTYKNTLIGGKFKADIEINHRIIYHWELQSGNLIELIKPTNWNSYKARLLNETEELVINAKYEFENLNGNISMTNPDNYILLGCGIFLMDRDRKEFGYDGGT